MFYTHVDEGRRGSNKQMPEPSLNKPIQHLEGEVHVLQQTLFRSKWKRRFLMVLNENLNVYESFDALSDGKEYIESISLLQANITERHQEGIPKGYDMDSCCHVEAGLKEISFVAQDLERWVYGLQVAKNYWVGKFTAAHHKERVEKLQSSVQEKTPDSSDNIDIDIMRYNGNMIRQSVAKNTKCCDLLKAVVTPQPGHHPLGKWYDSLTELWAVDKFGKDFKVDDDAVISQLYEDGCRFCILEHAVKPFVVFFPDGSFEVFPIYRKTTAGEVLRILVFQEKLAMLGVSNAALFYRNEDGFDELFNEDEKPLERLYNKKNGKSSCDNGGQFVFKNKNLPVQELVLRDSQEKVRVALARQRAKRKEEDSRREETLANLEAMRSNLKNSGKSKTEGVPSFVAKDDVHSIEYLQKRRKTTPPNDVGSQQQPAEAYKQNNSTKPVAILNQVCILSKKESEIPLTEAETIRDVVGVTDVAGNFEEKLEETQDKMSPNSSPQPEVFMALGSSDDGDNTFIGPVEVAESNDIVGGKSACERVEIIEKTVESSNSTEDVEVADPNVPEPDPLPVDAPVDESDSDNSSEEGIIEDFMESDDSSSTADIAVGDEGSSFDATESIPHHNADTCPDSGTNSETNISGPKSNGSGDDSHSSILPATREIKEQPGSSVSTTSDKQAKLKRQQSKSKSRRLPKNAPHCSKCKQLGSIRPYPVVRGKLLDYILRHCTKISENNNVGNNLDYICLSGVHLRNVLGVWEVADDTFVCSDSEGAVAKDVKMPDIYFGSELAVSIRRYILGSYLCIWYPAGEGNAKGKWTVVKNPEPELEPKKETEQEAVVTAPELPDMFKTESDTRVLTDNEGCMNAGSSEVPQEQNDMFESDSGLSTNTTVDNIVCQFELEPEQESPELVDRVYRKLSNVFVSMTPEILRRRSFARPTDRFLSPDLLRLRKDLLEPLKIAVNQIQCHFAAGLSEEDFLPLGDDSKAFPIGLIVRISFCKAFANILKTGFRGRNLSLQFLFGRPLNHNLWALVKAVGRAMGNRKMDVILEKVSNTQFAEDDEDRFRHAVTELLSTKNDEDKELLLMSWLRKFRTSEDILQKFYVPGSLWCSQFSLPSSHVIEELMTEVELACHYPYCLHLDFEYSYMKAMTEGRQELLLEREQAEVENDVVSFE